MAMFRRSAPDIKEAETVENVQDFFRKSKEGKKNSFLKKLFRNRNLGDVFFERLTLFFAVLVFLLVIFMGWEMYSHSLLSIKKFGTPFPLKI